MTGDPQLDVLLSARCVALCYVLYRIVLFTRRHGGNTELWGTIFESLTHYVQPQEPLKEPKQEIQQQKKQSGDEDPAGNWLPLWAWATGEENPKNVKMVDVFFAGLE